MPAHDISDHWLMKWLIKVPIKKVKSFTMRYMVILNTFVFYIPGLLLIPMVAVFNPFDLNHHFKIFLHAITVVYFVVFIAVVLDHVVHKIMRKKSVLSEFKKYLAKYPERNKENHKRKSIKEIAEQGEKEGSKILANLYDYQRKVLIGLLLFAFFYPSILLVFFPVL